MSEQTFTEDDFLGEPIKCSCGQERTKHDNKLCEIWHKAAGIPIDKFDNQSMNAMDWVKEFNRIEVTKGLQPTDPEWMLGWFANAIMAGYDEARRRYEKPTPEVMSESEIRQELLKVAIDTRQFNADPPRFIINVDVDQAASALSNKVKAEQKWCECIHVSDYIQGTCHRCKLQIKPSLSTSKIKELLYIYNPDGSVAVGLDKVIDKLNEVIVALNEIRQGKE